MVLNISLAGMISGCVAVLVGAGVVGTVAYVGGELQVTESKNVDMVYQAALKAVDDLQLKDVMKNKKVIDAVITARNEENKKVTIKLSVEDINVTKISIRVGTFGDKLKSRQIYSQIKKYL
jgi:hypothetical protein